MGLVTICTAVYGAALRILGGLLDILHGYNPECESIRKEFVKHTYFLD